jgi:hypothetical protein
LEREVRKGAAPDQDREIPGGETEGMKAFRVEQGGAEEDGVAGGADFVVIGEEGERVVMVGQEHEGREISQNHRVAGAITMRAEEPQDKWQACEHGERDQRGHEAVVDLTLRRYNVFQRPEVGSGR